MTRSSCWWWRLPIRNPIKKEPLFPVRQSDRQRLVRTTAKTRVWPFAATERFWRGSDGAKGMSLWSTAHGPPYFKYAQQNSNGYCVRPVVISMRSWQQRKASNLLSITYYAQPEIFSPALPKHHRDPGPQLQPWRLLVESILTKPPASKTSRPDWAACLSSGGEIHLANLLLGGFG